jgi:hypothetical protein
MRLNSVIRRRSIGMSAVCGLPPSARFTGSVATSTSFTVTFRCDSSGISEGE